ncbi:MAG: Fic family protein [Bryobacterales bacterium]|nr:Fic family protein [Bryobacterales bacterium]
MDQRSTAAYSYRWTHFKDLPGASKELADTELATLRKVWLEQKGGLEASGLLSTFTERLIREYAIEGGIIERAYTLDRGITQLLIEKGIDASLIPHNKTDRDPNLVARNIQAHQSVVEGVFDLVKGGRSLTVGVIKEMHAALLRHESTTSAVDTIGREVSVPLIKGAYKTLPNNPLRKDGLIHEYCPPEHVASEMDRLIASHAEHERQKVSAEVEAAWLHHAFTQIHPFQDGNGRIARLIASYVFIKNNYFPLTLVNDQDRDNYIACLEQADKGDLRPLISLFASVQRRTFVKVLGIASNVQERLGLDQIISAARHAIESRKEAHAQKLEQAKRTARILHKDATSTLETIAEKLRADLGPLSADFHFRVDSETNEGQRRRYFKGQVIEAAKTLDYFANVSVYHDWTRLILRADDQSEILVSFHGIGYEYRGILAASVGFYRRVETEEGERETTKATSACETVFQMNYVEAASESQRRFDVWLREAITKAMEMWRAGL